MIEVSDDAQSLTFAVFAALTPRLAAIAGAIGRCLLVAAEVAAV